MKTDIEIINKLIAGELFEDVKVTYIEILAKVKVRIDKELIKYIEAITDGDYYFYDSNRYLAIPRIDKKP